MGRDASVPSQSSADQETPGPHQSVRQQVTHVTHGAACERWGQWRSVARVHHTDGTTDPHQSKRPLKLGGHHWGVVDILLTPDTHADQWGRLHRA